MGYKICQVCGKFIRTNSNEEICESCMDRDTMEYSAVKEYLVRHQGASMAEIYTNTRIPLKTIKRFIEDRRIELR